MANLIIPAAGDGNRFKISGVTDPKPSIIVNGEPIIYWSLLGASKSLDYDRLIVGIREEHLESIKDSLDRASNNLNSLPPEIKVFSEKTSGPAETIYKILQSIPDMEGPVYCLDADSYIEVAYDLVSWLEGEECYLATCISKNPSHSYVKTDNELVTEIAEKSRISVEAVAGAYIFKSRDTYLNLYEEMNKNRPLNSSREIYLSDVAYESVKKNTCKKISSNVHVSLGTPEEVKVASKKIHKIKKEFLKLQGGSGASIFQITSGRGNVNLIKKSSGTSSEKLKEQFNFIEENKDKLKFPKILNSNSLSNYYFSYTMEKIEGSRELTKLVAELPTNKSKKLIKKILNKLEKFVYKNYKIEDIESDYIKKRFKLKIIEVDNLIRKSEFSEILETKFSINREECLSYSECVETLLKNLEFLDKGPRLKVSHGDLTFSNIMVSKDMELVFLDPNPSDNFNFLSSEIGKMYQSSDGMYETLASLNVKVSRKNDRKIGLKYSTLRAYKNKKISNFLSSYVVEKYGDEVLYSAKFYNLMHFFRLLPYKLKYEKHNFLKYFYVFLLLVTKESRKFTERSAETQRMETP